MPLQAKLLTVLQNRKVSRVGSNKETPINIRLICATNMPLYEMVKENRFRQDLLYRINTIEIEIPALRERFDIIGWDPRGTAQSTPVIDCIDDYDQYFAGDDTPQTDAERQQIVATDQEFAEGCEERSGAIIQHIGTNDSARDMDVIRRAVGEDKISYFGFSYGSELGATWATLFPDTVRAMVLDGAADPDADPVQSNLEQLHGFEASLDTFLAQCSEDESCAFNNRGDAATAFDTLMAQLDANPIPSAADRPPLNRAMATVASGGR